MNKQDLKDALREFSEEERDRKNGIDRCCPRLGCSLMRSQAQLSCIEDRCPFNGYERRY